MVPNKIKLCKTDRYYRMNIISFKNYTVNFYFINCTLKLFFLFVAFIVLFITRLITINCKLCIQITYSMTNLHAPVIQV